MRYNLYDSLEINWDRHLFKLAYWFVTACHIIKAKPTSQSNPSEQRQTFAAANEICAILFSANCGMYFTSHNFSVLSISIDRDLRTNWGLIRSVFVEYDYRIESRVFVVRRLDDLYVCISSHSRGTGECRLEKLHFLCGKARLYTSVCFLNRSYERKLYLFLHVLYKPSVSLSRWQITHVTILNVSFLTPPRCPVVRCSYSWCYTYSLFTVVHGRRRQTLP